MKTFLAILLAFALQAALAATPVPGGKWSFMFSDAKGRADRPVRVYTYRPRQCDTTCPIVFVMHGVKRDASRYREYWEFAADRYGFIIVAPEFIAWPRAAAYNLGDLATQADREKWTFSVIEHLFDEVRDGQKEYRIFGHGAGAQFVQRMALFRPDNRASVMVAASPGWYTMPEWRKDKGFDPFPYSLLNSRAGESELAQALAKRFVLMVADKDVEPDDENLGQAAGALKQGGGNIERGENFFKAATAAANDLGVKLAWELIEVPEASQDGEKMSRAAAEMLYARK